MAFQKRFKTDQTFVDNFSEFINALYSGENPCELLKEDTTKLEVIQFFAGHEYTSLSDFNHSLKSKTKRATSKEKKTKFLALNDLKIYPHSAYSIFLDEEKNKYKKENATLSGKDLKILMGNDWNEMDDDNSIKVKYNKIHQELKNKFLEQVKKIDPLAVKLFEKEKSTAPPRPYNIFVKEQMRINQDENNGLTAKEVMVLSGEKWKTLSEDEKKNYSVPSTNTDIETPVEEPVKNTKDSKKSSPTKATSKAKEEVKEVKEEKVEKVITKKSTAASKPKEEIKEVKEEKIIKKTATTKPKVEEVKEVKEKKVDTKKPTATTKAKVEEKAKTVSKKSLPSNIKSKSTDDEQEDDEEYATGDEEAKTVTVKKNALDEVMDDDDVTDSNDDDDDDN
jgi:hypothetical protein